MAARLAKAAVFLVGPRHETWDVDEGDYGDVETVASPHEPGALFRRVDVQDSRQYLGLVGDHADDLASDAAKTADEVERPQGVVLEQLAAVEDRAEQLLHVVGLVGRSGYQFGELGHEVVGVVGERRNGRVAQVVGGEIGKELTDLVEACFFVRGHEAGHSRLCGVRERATELLVGYVLACHGLHHVWPCDEHLRSPLDHEHKIGYRRAVDGTSGAAPHDDADLRHHS